jgi:Cu2+-exporting ATPase
MVKDPVCGMDVDPKKTKYKLMYQGQEYYFCSRVCMEEFSKDPQRYLSEGHHRDHAHHISDLRKRLVVSLILTIPIFLTSDVAKDLGLLLRYRDIIGLLSASLLFLYGGYPFLRGAISEIKERNIGMMLLVSIGISASFLYSLYSFILGEPKTFYLELALLIDIMLIGHFIEAKVISAATSSVDLLVRLLPHEAHLISDNGYKDVPVRELEPGDLVLVKSGEKVPADGVIVDGISSFNESILTGESAPVVKGKGGNVIAGSINLEGAVKIKVTRTGEESYLGQVERLIKEIRSSRSRFKEIADRAAFFLTIFVITSGIITLAYWLLNSSSLGFAIERAVSVVVVACPHALGLAIPIVIQRTAMLSSSRGILLRSKEALERAKDVKVIIFDKTGTLTEGRFSVKRIQTFNGFDELEVLRLAASLDSLSSHPVARAIVRKAEEMGINLAQVSEFRSVPGSGVEGIVEGKKVSINNVGSESLIAESGNTAIQILIDGVLAGVMEFEDKPKEGAERAIKMLKEMGYRVHMLTGDRKAVASKLSEILGIDSYHAEVKPHEKVNIIKEMQERGLAVAMVGDGINDAPALIQADVGIAIGAGTDIAIESADVILVRSDIEDVAYFFRLARSSYKKMLENLLWAIGYNSLTIPIAAGALAGLIVIGPAMGALIMSMSDVIVVLNAMSLNLRQ